MAPESTTSTTTNVVAADGGGVGQQQQQQQVSFGNAVPGIRKVDRVALLAREKAAVERDLKKDRARGRGVNKEGQDIYDALSRT